MRGRLLLQSTLMILLALPCAAQGKRVTFFQDTPLYDPLLADPRAQRIQLVVPGWSKEFPHSIEKGDRFAWQITAGDELPILKWSNQVGSGPLLNKGAFGVGLWIPVSFHVIEDFKDTSNPIVDTDYRFGFLTKFQYAVGSELRLGLKFSPWAHESTHLGDEYVILAEGDPAFERVNVSHEDWEYGVSLEGPQWKVRHGGIRPLKSKGYYSDHLLGSDVATLTPSRKNYEPTFGFEYAFGGLTWNHRQLYVSADLRNKLVYNYHQTAANPEEQQWSWNVHIGGVEEKNMNQGDRSPLKQIFVQFYRGVNPYGQLRSQKDYWSVGVGWVFGR